MEEFGLQREPKGNRLLEDTSDPDSFQAREKEDIDRFNRILRERVERQRKGTQHEDWMGNPLPPMLIEPMPTRASRLSRNITDEERQLRRQFLKDQQLAADEPKYIQELEPRNFFRRTFAAPWNQAALGVRGIFGQRVATNFRHWAPKLLLAYAIGVFGWYHIKYHRHTWEWTHGARLYSSQPTVFRNDKRYPLADPEPQDFSDSGFQTRKAFRN